MSQHKHLLDWAYHWEQKLPNKVCITQPLGGGDNNLLHLTFAEMMNISRRMATYLVEQNFPPKSTIAICSKNCAYWVMADLAIWMAGHVSVPIFPTLTANTLRYIIEHSEAKLLFVGKLDPIWEEMKAGVPEGLPQVAFPLAPTNTLPQWDEIVKNSAPVSDPVQREPEELATIIYTSGSTGRPKGVMHNFGTMVTCTEGLAKVVNTNANDRYLSYLPLAHGMERWTGECSMLYTGLHLFFAESLDTFVQDLQRTRPTLFMSVPRLWSKFQTGVYKKLPPQKFARLMKIPVLRTLVKKKILKQLGLDKVRFAGSGSAPIPKELIAWYRALGVELLEGYGMTENFNYSHLTKPGESRPGYVGTPYEDTQCRLADNGEIQIKGPGSMIGYYKMPEETKDAFTEDGFIRTGDRGEVDEQGRLKITGRTKEIFKTSKGKYVAPAPIENMLANHPHIEQCCVSGSGYPQPYALVQLSDEAREFATSGGQEVVRTELEEHLQRVNAKLPSYEKLEFITVVKDVWAPENGFLTPTMKIRRAKIEQACAPLADSWFEAKSQIVWESKSQLRN